mmetsp:Transcript_52776/g.118475  ORF Transcript_52776/g.118475 Transcript_52776/m.118475 type:complete len:81 (+) Transcript_52776:140-382(+)
MWSVGVEFKGLAVSPERPVCQLCRCDSKLTKERLEKLAMIHQAVVRHVGQPHTTITRIRDILPALYKLGWPHGVRVAAHR